MDPINSTDELQASINDLKNEQLAKRTVLNDNLHDVYDSLKPSHLLKSAINEVITSPEIKENIVNVSIGLTAGYLAKKIIVRRSSHPLTRIAGSLAEIGITNFVARNDETIKEFGKAFLKGVSEMRNSWRKQD